MKTYHGAFYWLLVGFMLCLLTAVCWISRTPESEEAWRYNQMAEEQK